MKPPLFLLLFLFFTTAASGQKLEEIFNMGEGNSGQGSTTLSVDQDVARGDASTDKAKQDSINQLYKKWNKFFTEKNETIQQIYNNLLQLDTNTITAADLKKYRRQVDDCKEELNDYINNTNDVSWKSFDDLVEMNSLFNKTYRNASAFLEDREGSVKKEKTNIWIVLGVCFAALMAIVPIFTQIKSGIMMKKVKADQQKMAKKQQEELEKQKLLSNENNVITIKD